MFGVFLLIVLIHHIEFDDKAHSKHHAKGKAVCESVKSSK